MSKLPNCLWPCLLNENEHPEYQVKYLFSWKLIIDDNAEMKFIE